VNHHKLLKADATIKLVYHTVELINI